MIDPAVYEAELGHRIGKTQGDGVAIPVMATGLGDLITWKPSLGGIVGLIFRENRGVGLGDVDSFLLLTEAVGVDHLASEFNWGVFPEAVAAQGAPDFDESFIFVPLPSLGGPGTVETLRKRPTLSAIQVMVDLRGPIGHRPVPGAAGVTVRAETNTGSYAPGIAPSTGPSPRRATGLTRDVKRGLLPMGSGKPLR